MPKTLPNRLSLASFETLVLKVKACFHEGRERVKQEMLRTYWQTGKFIHDHILLNQDRADYGKKLIPNLSRRVGISVRSLQEMHHFYRQFPKITRVRAQLSWTHLRKIAAISDTKLREEFVERAAKEKWSSLRLQSKIKVELRGKTKTGESKVSTAADYSEIVRPKLGTLYTYRLVQTPAKGGSLKLDMGFSTYRNSISGQFKAGSIVESRKKADGTYAAIKSERSTEDLFTYQAFVERVVDGDTLFVEIDLGFNNTTRQYLRLRALDAREMDTPGGRKAKAFVISLLKSVPFLIVTSTRSDKYDRYLADIFIPGKDFLKDWARGTARLSQSSDLLYLNNALLHQKLAVRMKY